MLILSRIVFIFVVFGLILNSKPAHAQKRAIKKIELQASEADSQYRGCLSVVNAKYKENGIGAVIVAAEVELPSKAMLSSLPLPKATRLAAIDYNFEELDCYKSAIGKIELEDTTLFSTLTSYYSTNLSTVIDALSNDTNPMLARDYNNQADFLYRTRKKVTDDLVAAEISSLQAKRNAKRKRFSDALRQAGQDLRKLDSGSVNHICILVDKLNKNGATYCEYSCGGRSIIEVQQSGFCPSNL